MDNMRVSAKAVIVRNDAMLVVEFDDESGLHYNLPGGGIEFNESIHDGLRREVKEETGVEVEPDRLLLVYEYFPEKCEGRYGSVRKLILFFRCRLSQGSEPTLPERPDPNQVAVRWIPLNELLDAPLLPNVGGRLVALLGSDGPPDFVEEA